MKLKTLLALSTFAISYFLFAMPANAAVTCQPIYGGGETCIQEGNLVIDKKVQNPETGEFVDNLGVNDVKFFADEQVNFKLTITNTGQAVLPKVTVEDVLPQFLTFVSGPGDFDTNTRTLFFETTNLNPGESRTFDVAVKVVPFDQIPNDKSITCVFNQAISASGSQVSQDNSQLCIERAEEVIPQVTTKGGLPTTKGGLKVFPSQPVKTTPSTGPEMLSLIGLIPAGFAGRFLRKKSLGK